MITGHGADTTDTRPYGNTGGHASDLQAATTSTSPSGTSEPGTVFVPEALPTSLARMCRASERSRGE